MNRNLKLWEAIKAFEDGKTVQYCRDGIWRDEECLQVILDSVRYNLELRIKPTTTTIPMGPTTCPSFPWAIMGPYWEDGAYLVVTAVDIIGVSAGRDFLSWKRLHEEGWLDYETGNPLCVGVTEEQDNES